VRDNNNNEILTLDNFNTSSVTTQTIGSRGYVKFSVGVTEYCGAELGSPLLARGYFATDNGGEHIQINGKTITRINLGYPYYLQIGPCKLSVVVVGI
jgi:hypothetical protein